MKLLALLAVLSLAACGGGSKQAPAVAAPAGDPAADDGDGADGPELDENGDCCCELPADPPEFEILPQEQCHEDSHGTCARSLSSCDA